MVASLLKVICSGMEDERIGFRPTLYPFQKVWKKAGRFTTQWVRLDFENVPTFGQTGFFRLLRKGHLLTRLYLVAEMPDIYSAQRRAYRANGNQWAYPRFGWTNSLGHALLQEATLDIANSRVETLDSRLLEVLDEFYTPLEKVPSVNDGIKRKDNGFTSQSFGWPMGAGSAEGAFRERVMVPLPFWFSRGDSGCALPIDAMSMDEVRCSVTFRDISGLYFTETHVPGGGAQGSALWPLSGSSLYGSDPMLHPSAVPLTDINGAIKMPSGGGLSLGDCYVMAEYIYLDQNEANRFRLADIQVPIVRHYAMNPFDTRGLLNARISLDIPNPTRGVMFLCQPIEATDYNAHFLATRDMTGNVNTLPNGSAYPWWPDAVGLRADRATTGLRPAFALSDSEPVSGYSLEYQGSLVRYRTEGASLFRSVIPSYEMRKSPWVNRYYYYLSFGIQNGWTPFSAPRGEANLDKMTRRELVLQFRTRYGNTSGLEVGRFMVYVYAETYNILRVYGGRAGMLFA
jgi:hypothetical protein